jgi:hypothetical protein
MFHIPIGLAIVVRGLLSAFARVEATLSLHELERRLKIANISAPCEGPGSDHRSHGQRQ